MVRMDEEKRSDGGDKWYIENSSKIPSRDAIVPPCQGQERSRTLVKEEVRKENLQHKMTTKDTMKTGRKEPCVTA